MSTEVIQPVDYTAKDSAQPNAVETDATQPEASDATQPEASDASSASDITPSVTLGNKPNLWDEAYDSLKTEYPDLLSSYEAILAIWMEGEPRSLELRRPSMTRENNIDSLDLQNRRAQMHKIVDIWLSKTDEVTDYTSIQNLKSTFRSMNVDYPENALVWAAVCVSLQGILDSKSRPDSIVAGVVYVLSRMAWYSILPQLLIQDEKNTTGDCYSTEQGILRSRIVDVYKAILSYQIKIVCSQSPYSSDLVDLNDLSQANIVSAEEGLSTFSGQQVETQIKQLLESLQNSDEQSDSSTDEEESNTRTDTGSEDEVPILDTIGRQHNIPNPEGGLKTTLERLFDWVTSTKEYEEFDKTARVLWVFGALGTGKAMLVTAIIHGYYSQGLGGGDSPELLSHFRGSDPTEPKNAAWVLRSLIGLTLDSQPSLKNHFVEARKRTERKGFDEPTDFYALSIIFYNIIQDEKFANTLFIVDGAGEYNSTQITALLSLISASLGLSSKVRWLVSLGREKSELCFPGQVDLCLDSYSEELSAIFREHYIPSEVSELVQCGMHFKGDLETEVIRCLRDSSPWNYLWIEIACEAIKQNDSWHAPKIIRQLPADIESLYTHMKKSIKKLYSTDPDYCNQILLVMVVAYRPLPILDLEELVDLPPEVNLSILVNKGCFSFLKAYDDVICFRHQSARDFIEREMSDKIQDTHWKIVRCSFRSLSRSWGGSPGDSSQDHPESLRKSTSYIAVFWIKHLCESHITDEVRDTVIHFLTEYPLKWLELLSSTGHLSRALSLIQELETVWKRKAKSDKDESSNIKHILEFIFEARQLFLLHQSIGCSQKLRAQNTLLFCPSNSKLRKRLLPTEFPELVVPPALGKDWGLAMRVLRGHTDYVRCCAHSHSGELLASGSDDGSIRIWDTRTGNLQHLLELSNWVHHVAFSSKGVLAASTAHTIKFWDVTTGVLKETPSYSNIFGDTGASGISDFDFSADGNMLVACSGSTIVTWDFLSCSRRIWKNPDSAIFNVSFSGDGALFASASENHVIIWDVKSEEKLKDLPAPDGMTIIRAGITFSADSKFVATGTDQGTVLIWELLSENPPTRLEGHTDSISAVSFFPEGLRLASASQDTTIRIWKGPYNGASKVSEQIIRGHREAVRGLSFSQTQRHLASCSDDETLCIWDYDTDEPIAETDDGTLWRDQPHMQPISVITSSDDGNVIASADEDGLICLWNGITGEFQHKLEGHGSKVRSIMISHHANLLVSASNDRTVRIWDTNNESKPRILHGHEDWVRSAVFSYDERFVASGSDDRTIRIWNVANEIIPEAKGTNTSGNDNADQEGLIVYKHKDWVMSIAFSSDGNYLAAGGDDGHVLLLKLQNGQWNVVELQEPDVEEDDDGWYSALAVAFTPNSGLLIASSYKVVRVWNVETRDRVRVFRTTTMFCTMHTNPTYPEYFITEMGPFLINPPAGSSSSSSIESIEWYPYSFEPDQGQIIYKNNTLFVLPEQYRPTSSSVAVSMGRDKVVIGSRSGLVLFFIFKRTKPL
ncbi:WD40-repeat-containing domain protein [Daldinia vernicosa]|uniref:WD40-repeat-containing domain protein n=1 Tax=Daldinia vernicosa TaxID=114800 RepID=UPI0020081286|nr:WD40-repeat-containing domain protein [Daldinia vernicosa]KAI0849802.1 WD40-repeat-containing domain protein [Daldinia vernicosa]